MNVTNAALIPIEKTGSAIPPLSNMQTIHPECYLAS